MIEPYVLTSPGFLPPGTFGPVASWICAVGLLGLGFGSFIAFLVLRARALQKMQEREHALLQEGADKALLPGPARVVKGRVELDGGDGIAVGVDNRQAVKNHPSRNGKWHTWEEVSRTVHAVPFYLVRDDGQSVYVEVSEAALVVDALETKYPIDLPSLRVRSADVRRGERFFAYGDLVEGMHPRGGDAYRGGSGWILRAPPGGRLLLATDAIRDRYVGRIAFLREWAAWLALAFCGLHAVFTLPFVADSLFGTRATATLADLGTYVTRSKGHTTTHYVLTARAADGFTLKDQVSSTVYDEAQRAQSRGIVVVPIIRVGNWEGASFLGDEPYVYGSWVVLGIAGAAVTLLLMRFAYPFSYAWYDRAKLGERGGTGHWNETRPGAPIAPVV